MLKSTLLVTIFLLSSCSPTVFYRRTQVTVDTGYPQNAIVAFNSATCPTGWEDFNDLNGRFILGAGSGNLDAGGAALTLRTLHSSGGKEYTTGIPAYSGLGNHNNPSFDRVLASSSTGGYSTTAADPMISGDGSVSEANLPPFIVKKYCKKTSLLNTVPSSSMISIPSASCPSNWVSETSTTGKFIIGSGVGNNDSSGSPLTLRTLNSVGGFSNTPGGFFINSDGTSSESPSPSAYLSPLNLFSGTIGVNTIGGLASESNLPPYIVHQYCNPSTELSALPKDSIVAFDLSSCPSGWSDYSLAQGRMIYGKSPSKSIEDSGGREYTTGVPTSDQTVLGSDPTYRFIGSSLPDQYYSDQPADTTINGPKADSNLPPYFVLKYCKKD